MRIMVGAMFWLLLGATAAAQPRVPYRSPELAACKSVILPGWGQWSNGDSNMAAALFTAGAVGVLFGTRTVGVASSPRRIETERGFGWLLYGISVVLGGFDAYVRARELNHENGYDVGRVEFGFDGGAGVRVTLWQGRFGGS